MAFRALGLSAEAGSSWHRQRLQDSPALHSAKLGKSALIPAYFNDYGSGCLGALGVLAALLRRADEGGSWLVRMALAKTAMLGTRFADNREPAVPIADSELDRYLVDQDSPIGLLTRVARSAVGLDEVAGNIVRRRQLRVLRHWTSAGVLICLYRMLCRIGRPLSSASASPVGAAHRLFDQRSGRHIAGASGLQLTMLGLTVLEPPCEGIRSQNEIPVELVRQTNLQKSPTPTMTCSETCSTTAEMRSKGAAYCTP